MVGHEPVARYWPELGVSGLHPASAFSVVGSAVGVFRQLVRTQGEGNEIIEAPPRSSVQLVS